MFADTIENATTVITKSTVIVDFSMSLSSILHSQDVHDDDNDDGAVRIIMYLDTTYTNFWSFYLHITIMRVSVSLIVNLISTDKQAKHIIVKLLL